MNKPPIILGTAEFNPIGYGNKSPLDITEIRKILALAKEAGIYILDTAESYGCVDIIRKEAKGFCIYTKTRDWKVQLEWGNNELRGILYHYTQQEQRVELPFIHKWINLGTSVYKTEQLPDNMLRIIQVPFSIGDVNFKHVFSTYRTVFVRSVFGNGELLKHYSIKQCLDFVTKYSPDGIVIGVNRAKELEQILKVY